MSKTCDTPKLATRSKFINQTRTRAQEFVALLGQCKLKLNSPSYPTTSFNDDLSAFGSSMACAAALEPFLVPWLLRMPSMM